MTKEITINFLQHRRDFRKLFMYFMNRLKPENKKLIKINFLMTDKLDFNWIKSDIEIDVVNFGGTLWDNNYYKKFMYALNQDSKYYVTLGEDLFMSNHVWDYMIENRNVLDDGQILSLSPVINIGVPTCDLFMEDFCTQEQIQEIHKIFLKMDFNQTCSKRWDIYEYGILNKHTINAEKWEPEEFAKTLATVNTELKGVHPVRFSYEAQRLLCDFVLQNVPKFIEKQNFSIITPFRPYLCNEMSLMRVDVLRKIHDELGFNPYDEVSINNYREQNNLTYAFVKKGYSLHTLFAYVSRSDPAVWERTRLEELEMHDVILKKSQEYNHFDLSL